MKSVRQMLGEKGNNVWSIDLNASIADALELMAEKDIGALLVIDNGRPVGIFSERDYARGSVRGQNVTLDSPVHEVMTPSLYMSRLINRSRNAWL